MPFRRRPVPVVTDLPPRRRRRRGVLVAVAAGALLVAGGAGTAAALAPAPRVAAAGTAIAAPAHVDTTGFPRGGAGIFTDTCSRVRTAADDPIRMPGMAGEAMQHDFFGDTGTTASSTPAQLVGHATSCTTTADASAYWTPVLYQDGRALVPQRTLLYWRAPATTAHSTAAVPAGLTEVAGNETASSPQGTRVVAWTCSTPKDGTPGTSTASPHDCPPGTMLRVVITFPSCWDGHTLDGAAQRNVVYPSSPRAACPASHPVQIPQVVFHANYPTTSAADLTLSIGPDAQGPVTTEHADFMNGWDERVLSADVAACTTTGVQCGPVEGAAAVPQGGQDPALRKAHEQGAAEQRRHGARPAPRTTAAPSGGTSA